MNVSNKHNQNRYQCIYLPIKLIMDLISMPDNLQTEFGRVTLKCQHNTRAPESFIVNMFLVSPIYTRPQRNCIRFSAELSYNRSSY